MPGKEDGTKVLATFARGKEYASRPANARDGAQLFVESAVDGLRLGHDMRRGATALMLTEEKRFLTLIMSSYGLGEKGSQHLVRMPATMLWPSHDTREDALFLVSVGMKYARGVRARRIVTIMGQATSFLAFTGKASPG
jgi:hypothetical protein